MEQNLSKYKIWWLAIRPKTLPAAVSPVLVGTGLAIHDGYLNLFPAIIALIGSLLIQILSNLANDYYDYLKGYDTEERTGPTRVAASGLLSVRELKAGIIANIILAMLIGLYLIWVGGLPILLIGVFSLIFAVLYSGGPYPLSTIGLGDLFVFIFFGLVAVGGTYYVQVLSFTSEVLLAAVPVGLIITAVLVINNYRDFETDKSVGKFTLAVFMGKRNTRIYYVSLLFISYIIPFILFFFFSHSFLILLPTLSLYLSIPLVRNVYKGNMGALMNKTLGGTAQLGLIFSLLYSIGLIF